MFENKINEFNQSKSTIFHIDINSAFLSWEAVYRLKHLGGTLDLRTIPSAVGGDASTRHGIILAKSMPAKKFGIHTGESIMEAKRKCPNIVLVPPNYGLFETSSRAFIELLKEYSPDVEQYSVDEAFINMTGTEKIFGPPVIAANMIKNRIRDELGFTANIGISSNKLLAKMASDFKKPDLVHTLYKEEIKDKMWPLPVSELFFVGKATAQRLIALGIRTIGELASADRDMLRYHFKKFGDLIYEFACGEDISAVEPPPLHKGYGNSTTTSYDVRDMESAKLILLALSETVCTRLRKAGAKARTVSVSVKDYNFQTSSHQMVLDSNTDITIEIYQAACKLFDKLWDRTPLRHMGIQTSQLCYDEFTRQLNLFSDFDYEKIEKAENAIDIIRQRYGNDAVKRAAFISSPVYHMSGGILREKHSVDYDNVDIV